MGGGGKAFKSQPQGEQTWKRYLPLKAEASGDSSVSYWKDERGSY